MKTPDRLKIMGCRNICHTNLNQDDTGIAMLNSEVANFRTRDIIKDEEGYHK